ncbi:MAG: hypothetical protein H6716_17280 [Polyangiaceae bacterium]|nr:hypothetical protein [Polyangiaceae bacterium]
MRWKRSLGLTLLVGGLGLVGFQRDARACDNAVFSRVDLGIAWAKRTEGKLNRGRNKETVEAVLARHPRVHTMDVTHDVIGNRALRIMALAVVRLHGEVAKAKGFPSGTPEQKQANLEWSADRLRKLYARHPDDATLRCDLGEVLAAQQKHWSEAFELLDNVEQRDLMVSPPGYDALAKIRTERHQKRPAFLAAPGGELDRLRVELEKARSVRMDGKSVPRPMNAKDVARGRAQAPQTTRSARYRGARIDI